jgi:hypothetical protein
VCFKCILVKYTHPVVCNKHNFQHPPVCVINQPAMAPPPTELCSAPVCAYKTEEGIRIPTFQVRFQTMELHARVAHPAAAAAARPLIAKVEQRPRPRLGINASKHDFRFFSSEWRDYKEYWPHR